MSRRAYVLAAAFVVLAVTGWWSRARTARLDSEAAAAGRQTAEIRELLVDSRPLATAGAEHGGPTEHIGQSVQHAAREGGLNPANVHGVRPSTGASGRPRYRMTIKAARIEPLVRFLHALEVEERLRTVELDLSRPNGSLAWDASVLLGRPR